MKTLIAAAVVTMFGLAPAMAQDKMMKCTDADMMKMNTDIKAMSDGKSKSMAMDHMKMAKDKMSAKDMAACETQMHQAMEAMKK